MSNEQKKSRTLIEDLPVAEQALTTEEMENVQGGKTFFESRSNTTKEGQSATTTDPTTLPAPTPATTPTPTPPPTSTPKTQTPL